jgi:hypothetical protein
MDAPLAVGRLPRRSCRSDTVGASTLPRGRTRTATRTARASARPVGEPATCTTARPDRLGQRSGDDGRRPSRTPGRAGAPRRRIRPDRADGAASISASLEGPRAAWSSRRWVEARCVQRRSRSAAGGTPSEASQDCACRVRWCSGAEFAVAVTWGRRGDRSRRARGGAEDGVQRLGAVVALCSAGRSWRAARGWPGRTPGPAGGRVPPRPGQSRRRREGPCRPAGGPRGPLWPAGGLRRPC